MTTPHTRAQAAEAGLTKYHGNPCRRGHTLRYTINGACVACQAAWVHSNRAGMRLKIKSRRGA